MKATPQDFQLLALKLLETFTHQWPRRYGFERYWPLAAPVESFLEQASNPVEQAVAKALHSALETLLKEYAPKSDHLDAPAVTAFLGAKPYERIWKRRRKSYRKSPARRDRR